MARSLGLTSSKELKAFCETRGAERMRLKDDCTSCQQVYTTQNPLASIGFIETKTGTRLLYGLCAACHAVPRADASIAQAIVDTLYFELSAALGKDPVQA